MDFFRDIVMVAATTPAASAAPGYAAWPALVGAERIQGGGCNDPNDWTLGTGVTVNVVAGKMVATTASAFVQNDGTMDGFIEGSTVRTSGTVDTATLGSFIILVENVSGAPITTAGAFSQDIVAGEAGNDGWQLQFTSATMQLDSFSVKSIGLMGVEGDWAFGGNWVWGGANAQSLSGVGISQSDIVSLTGSALTSFTAAVSFNTACLVSVYVEASLFEAENVSVRVHQGSWVALNITTSGWSTPVAVTSGAVAGFEIRGNAGGTAEVIIQAVQIALA